MTTPTESMVLVQRGAVVSCDDEDNAVEIAASIYLLDNELRPESEWDPLPAHLTAEDIVRAKRRLEARHARNRMGAAETERLPHPSPRQSFICITQGCHTISDHPGACEQCQRDFAAGKFDRISPKVMRAVVVVLMLIAVGCMVCAAVTYPWSKPW